MFGLVELKENRGSNYFNILPQETVREGYALSDAFRNVEQGVDPLAGIAVGRRPSQCSQPVEGNSGQPETTKEDDQKIEMKPTQDKGDDKEDDVAEGEEVEPCLEKQDSCIASLDDLADIKNIIDTTDAKTALRMKKNLFLSDLSVKLRDPKKSKSVYQKSLLYVNIVMLISMYYSLPVIQMVLRYNTVVIFEPNYKMLQ